MQHLPPDDHDREVFKESGNQCACCGSDKRLSTVVIDQDAIDQDSESNSDCVDRLICLCVECRCQFDSGKMKLGDLSEFKDKPFIAREFESASARAHRVLIRLRFDSAAAVKDRSNTDRIVFRKEIQSVINRLLGKTYGLNAESHRESDSQPP